MLCTLKVLSIMCCGHTVGELVVFIWMRGGWTEDEKFKLNF